MPGNPDHSWRAAFTRKATGKFARHLPHLSHSGSMAIDLPRRYDSGMDGEQPLLRKLSPEFWAVIGSAVTLLVAVVGTAALILTVAGWIREDMRSMDIKLGGLNTRLSGEIRALDTKLSREINVLDTKLSGEIRKLDEKIGILDKRLAVVESHVLDMRPTIRVEPLARSQVH